jgi:SAM-dependent methyltransferase
VSMKAWGLPVDVILRELAANAAMGIPAIRRQRLKVPRTSADSMTIEARKIIAEFEFFADSAGPLNGKTVVEIGPGDALGLAPLFLSAGAERYVAMDRFLGNVWGERAVKLYDELARIRGCHLGGWTDRVELLDLSIERAHDRPPKADVLVSFDVLEHLSDLPSAVRNMAAILKPNGAMFHRVDYGPHGVWLSANDYLSFLRVPRWVWIAMGSNRGYPNRTRHHELVRLLQDAGLRVCSRITRSVDGDVMDAEVACAPAELPRLGRQFADPKV